MKTWCVLVTESFRLDYIQRRSMNISSTKVLLQLMQHRIIDCRKMWIFAPHHMLLKHEKVSRMKDMSYVHRF